MTTTSPFKIAATMAVRTDEATIVVGDGRVTVVIGDLDVLLTPDAAIRLANQLTDAVDELDRRTADSARNQIRGQS